MARNTGAVFKELSATDSNIADVRNVAEEARGALSLTGRFVVRAQEFHIHRRSSALQENHFISRRGTSL